MDEWCECGHSAIHHSHNMPYGKNICWVSYCNCQQFVPQQDEHRHEKEQRRGGS